MPMSIATRASACASCGKRLTRKQWYYRNGRYFCTRRCWDTEREKASANPDAPKAKAAQPDASTPEAERTAPKSDASPASS